MIEMNAVVAGTELDAARDAGREGVSAGWCAWSAGDASLTFSLVVRPDVNMPAVCGRDGHDGRARGHGIDAGVGPCR